MKMNDNEIRDFFQSNRPSTTDEGTYLVALNSRLDAIEEIKRIHDKEAARYRKITALALICGIVIGAAVIAFIIFKPVHAPELDKSLIASVSSFIAEWKTFFIAAIAILALTFGLLPLGKTSSDIL